MNVMDSFSVKYTIYNNYNITHIHTHTRARILDVWRKYCKNLYTDKLTNTQNQEPCSHLSIIEPNIFREVIWVISIFKNNKVCGPDDISSEIII